jgi:hypothetical protein
MSKLVSKGKGTWFCYNGSSRSRTQGEERRIATRIRKRKNDSTHLYLSIVLVDSSSTTLT